jgi:4-hydroxy-tetrahydrodipicolinate reductase
VSDGVIGGGDCRRHARHTIGIEIRFGREDERLILQYGAGPGAAPYIAGTLLAIRRVPQFIGLVRGLDRILE